MKQVFQITKEFRFEAAHQLMNHDGKCRRLHGHSFKMRLILQGEDTVKSGHKTGMLQDFGEISQHVKPFVDDMLDHQFLNETLKMADPTSENIAQFVYRLFKPRLPMLKAVEVDETCTCSCRYEVFN